MGDDDDGEGGASNTIILDHILSCFDKQFEIKSTTTTTTGDDIGIKEEVRMTFKEESNIITPPSPPLWIAHRCVILAETLSATSHQTYIQNWSLTITAVNKKMSQAKKLLHELLGEEEDGTLSIPDNVVAQIVASTKIRNYINGLRECMRVVRYITASVCDLFCLTVDTNPGESSDFTATTASNIKPDSIIFGNNQQRNRAAVVVASSENLFDRIYELEKCWKEVCVIYLQLGITVTKGWDLPQVSQIREKVSDIDIDDNDESPRDDGGDDHFRFCDLTLRPFSGLVNEQTTEIVTRSQKTNTPVTLGGKQFFACSVNLWSNLVSVVNVAS